MVGIWLEYGRNEVGMRSEYGRNEVGMRSEYGRNEVGMRSEYGGNEVGMGKKWAKKYIFFLLGIYSDSARNDSEWLGMDKNLSLNIFTRNEVGIWSDSYLFGRIRSDSYHSARIRSECVGEGKVLQNWAKVNFFLRPFELD